MARLDHSRTNARERMARKGVDRIDDFDLPGGLTPPRPRPSKADLRAELAAAMDRVTRIVRCSGCGHSAAVALPPSRLNAKLRCSKCSSLANIEKEKPAGRKRGGLIE